MWKDTREARLRRYREILKGSPLLYSMAEASGEGALHREGTENPKEPGAEGAQRTFENVCDYVLAPALNSFVQWVLQEAVDAGKKRLYFLARDGYFMYLAALAYCEKLDLPLECRYLSCSRYSIRIPMFHLDMEEAMDYICRGGIDVTMDRILNRAGLTEEEKGNVLARMGNGCGKDAIIPYADLPVIRRKLEQDKYFIACVERHSREAMPHLEGYLIQEGLFDGTPSALVDSGWVGSMQKVLNRLTEYIGRKHGFTDRTALEGYYWGMYELPPGVGQGEYHCYYFSPEENLREKVYFSNCLFEGIFSAPHGMTLGYEEAGYCQSGERKTGYRPVYAAIPDGQKRFVEATGQRLLDDTEKLVDTFPATGRKDIFNPENLRRDRQTVSRLLELFMGHPTVWEAEVYGNLHFSDDVLDYSGRRMAEPMSQEELASNHLWRKAWSMLGIRKKCVKESAWYEGSAVRGGKHVERHLRRYAGYKYLLYMKKTHQTKKNENRMKKR